MRAGDFHLGEEPAAATAGRDERPQGVGAGVGIEAVDGAHAALEVIETAGLTVIADQDETAIVGAAATGRAVARRGNQLDGIGETVDQVIAAALTDEKPGIGQQAGYGKPAGQAIGHAAETFCHETASEDRP